MKSDRSLSDLAARSLSVDASRPADVSPGARASTIEAMTRAMRQRKHRARARWTAIGGAFVAAAAAVALLVGRGRHDGGVTRASASAVLVTGAPLVVTSGVRRPLAVGTTIDSGDHILVERGSRATVAVARGTYLVMEDAAEVAIASLVPAEFDLASGTVRADVAKLGPGERFVIRTADAVVEVHGTSFEVSRVEGDPRCGDGTTTRVKVFEGIVSVRANGTESLVHPHEAWPRDCGSARVEGAPPAAAPPRVAASSAPRRPTAPPSDLAAQNDLFDKAIARKRAGDAKGAVVVFDEMLARFPAGHLAQSARAERMKLLRGSDPERARAAARDYLSHHPDGFARSDAELILRD